MKLKQESFGIYETNCYLIHLDNLDVIIDPGYGAFEWIKENVKNTCAIFLTHGHFDHIADVAKIANHYKCQVFCPDLDNFMLKEDIFNLNVTPYKDAIPVATKCSSEIVEIQNHKIIFHHFPGHSPGCCMIEIVDFKHNEEEVIFSGDFIFHRSIGRYDFPHSSVADMKKSLERFCDINRKDLLLLPGHGDVARFHEEQRNVKILLQRFSI